MPKPAVPDTLLLRPSNRKWLWTFVGCVVFVILGIFAATADNWLTRLIGSWGGWLGACFFGLGAILSLTQLAPGANYLRLARDHFELRKFWRSSRIRWADVEPFLIVTMYGVSVVAWNWKKGATLPSGAAFNRGMTGIDAVLPHGYGPSPDELKDVMNAWRDRAREPAGIKPSR